MRAWASRMLRKTLKSTTARRRQVFTSALGYRRCANAGSTTQLKFRELAEVQEDMQTTACAARRDRFRCTAQHDQSCVANLRWASPIFKLVRARCTGCEDRNKTFARSAPAALWHERYDHIYLRPSIPSPNRIYVRRYDHHRCFV